MTYSVLFDQNRHFIELSSWFSLKLALLKNNSSFAIFYRCLLKNHFLVIWCHLIKQSELSVVRITFLISFLPYPLFSCNSRSVCIFNLFSVHFYINFLKGNQGRKIAQLQTGTSHCVEDLKKENKRFIHLWAQWSHLWKSKTQVAVSYTIYRPFSIIPDPLRPTLTIW